MSSSFKKKGSSVIDIIFIMVVVVVLGLAVFFIKLSFDDVSAELVASGDLGTQGTAILQSANNSFAGWSDYGIGFVFFGLIMGIMITSYFVDVHPVFFVLSLILFIFVIFAGVYVSNSFQEVVADADLVTLQQSFPITMFIINNLIMLLIATFVLMSIILYGKNRDSSGGAY